MGIRLRSESGQDQSLGSTKYIGHYGTLPSGFDERAISIFQNRLKFLLKQTCMRQIRTVNVTPVMFDVVIDPMLTAYSNFWDDVQKGSWEVDTFKHYFQFLTSSSTLVDFGPTILYGAQLAHRTFGIEVILQL